MPTFHSGLTELCKMGINPTTRSCWDISLRRKNRFILNYTSVSLFLSLFPLSDSYPLITRLICPFSVLVFLGIHYRKSCASSGACLIASSGYQQFCTGKLNSVCITCCNTPLCNGPRQKKRPTPSAGVALSTTRLPVFSLYVLLSSALCWQSWRENVVTAATTWTDLSQRHWRIRRCKIPCTVICSSLSVAARLQTNTHWRTFFIITRVVNMMAAVQLDEVTIEDGAAEETAPGFCVGQQVAHSHPSFVYSRNKVEHEARCRKTTVQIRQSSSEPEEELRALF